MSLTPRKQFAPFIFSTWPWASAALSGGLLALCFPRWNQGWLCWIALTPLISAVWFSPRGKRDPLRTALLGYLCGFVFFTGTFYWLSSLGTLFHSVWLHGIPPLLALYMAGYFAFWTWFIGCILAPGHDDRRFPKSLRNLATGFLGAAAWVAQEWVRSWFLGGFGWNGLGVALHRDLPMIQIADIVGVPGLSFLVAFCNLMAVIVVRRITVEFGPVFLKRVRWEFTFTVALVAVVFSYGVRALVSKREVGVPLRVAMIQPNIPQLDKWNPDAEDRIFERLDLLTRAVAMSAPDLIVWPETATPRGIFADEMNYRFVLNQFERGDFALLLGTLDADLATGEEFNVATLLTERGKCIVTHRKIHLVPFGEYVPLRKTFPLFAKIAGDLVPGDFAAGHELTVMELPKPPVRLSPLICFEDTDGDLTRRFVNRGAQLLINITNDGWFLKTAGAEQHLANAVFRTIENRRPLLRCTNTGVTCSVDLCGRVKLWNEPFREEASPAHEVRVPQEGALTFYARHGEFVACGCGVLTPLVLVFSAWLRRRRK